MKIAWNRDLVDTLSKPWGLWCTETESIDDLFSISVPCVAPQGTIFLSCWVGDSMGKWNLRQIRKEKCRHLTWKVASSPCVSPSLLRGTSKVGLPAKAMCCKCRWIPRNYSCRLLVDLFFNESAATLQRAWYRTGTSFSPRSMDMRIMEWHSAVGYGSARISSERPLSCAWNMCNGCWEKASGSE